MATVTSSKRQLTHTSNTYESNGDVTIGGNLNINGTTTTIDTANLLVEDKNIIIGDVSSPTDSTADGGGITLKGATDKTLTWVNSSDAWTFNQNLTATGYIHTDSNLSATGNLETNGTFILNTISAQNSEATALVINGSGLVGTRELGSNAFNSTSFAAASHTHAASDITSGTFATARIPSLAASKITSGTFADARIAQSNVTQHQAALSITESQISDFGSYLTSFTETNTFLGDGGSLTTHPGTNKLIYTGQINAGTSGLFATSDNSNSVLTLNRHSGNYNSQLGFSSNGNIYYRKFSNSTNNSQAWNTVWHSGSDGTGSGLDADKLDGEEGSHYLDYNNFTNTPVDQDTTYSAGNGISLSSTTFSVAAGGGLTQTSTGLSHSDTSNQASVNNSNGNVIQDVTLDTYGHVTALNTANLDGRYYTEGEIDTIESDLYTAIGLKANLASPALTGIPTAPTPSLSDDNTNIATTEYVKGQGYITSADGGNATTLDGIDSSAFLRSNANDSFSGNLTNNGSNHITFGPNSTWAKNLRIGGNGHQGNSTTANIATTNGNLHLDAAVGSYGTYLNYYSGTTGVSFGNGASASVAWMGPDGDLWKGAGDNTGSKYWHAGNMGTGSNLDADSTDGLHVHNTQGTQNSANAILRTQANGYTKLGWIETVSGDNGTTAISKIYASHDNYIRYYTPANFGAQIGSHISYNDLTNKPTIPSLSGYATEAHVSSEISNLVNGAPAALDTLNELAAAIDDNASYASSITTALSGKASLSGSNSFTNSYNEFGNSTGSVSNDGSWNARVNIAGSSHAKLDVKSVSDGIITTLYAHSGHNAGKIGTTSGHKVEFMTGGSTQATLNTNGTFYLGSNRVFADNYHPNADTLTTARTISLAGDVTGSVSFNGSSNVSITTVVGNDSHTHDGRYYTETESANHFKTLVVQGNFMNTYSWSGDTVGSANSGWSALGSAAPFSGTDSYGQNGTDAENSRAIATLPNGAKGVVWRTPSNDSSSNDDGGWNCNINGVDSSKSYRSVIYFRKTDDSNNGQFYHGCHGSHTLNIDGSANTNPYFASLSISNFVQDRWYVSIGYIQPYQSSGAVTSGQSGVYDCTTGKLVSGGQDFMMKSGSTTQNHRTYLYYSTDTNTSVEFYAPRFEELNGNEPSKQELVNKGLDGLDAMSFHSKYDPEALTQLTESSDANDDKFLLWDESASVWKYMRLDDLQDSIDNNTTYVAGNGISLSSTTFSVSAGGGLTQTSTGLSHTDTSTQGSVNNSSGTVIQDITLDTYGHITAIGSANLDGRYYTETETNGFLNLKADLASPALTGNPTAPTQAANNNSTRIATTAYVQTEIADLIGAAPAALDTLSELADAINDDSAFSSTVTTALGNRLRVDTASQGLNSTQKSNARTNLGLGSAATSNTSAFLGATAKAADSELLDGEEGSHYLDYNNFTNTPVDQDTTYSAGTGISLSGTTFSLTDTASKLSLSGGTMTGTLNSRDIKFANGYHLMRSNHSSGHLEGSYNNVGANGGKSNPIYTIGSSYNPTDAALSNMYGIGYNHTDASFISFTGASGWGQYVAADGDARIFLCGSNGVISSTGEHYVGSNRVHHNGYHPNADTLTTARTIAGTSFNGSANIDISYNNLTNKPTIPTNNNQLTNGANYVTSSGNTIIGTDSDIDTSGATVIDQLNMTDGVITSHSTRTLTLANLGYTGATNANNYSLPEATATARGGIELFSNTDQSYPANAVTDTSGRTYGIQLNSAGQAVVNVPWSDTNTDTNTTYTAGRGLDLSGTQFQLETDLRDTISYIGYDSNDYIQWSNNSYCRTVVSGSERLRVKTDGIDVTGVVVANAIRTKAASTSYSLITRNTGASNYVLYVQATQSGGTQKIATFGYGSGTAGQATEVFRIARGQINAYSSNLTVGGSITGNSKNFSIPHPTKEGKRLVHSCLEGPEIGVYFRGRSQSSTIEMPDYWGGLVDLDSMTVELTAIGPNQDLYVEDIADDGDVTVGSNTETALNYFYVVYGERKDMDKLEIEVDDTGEFEAGDGNSEEESEE